MFLNNMYKKATTSKNERLKGESGEQCLAVVDVEDSFWLYLSLSFLRLFIFSSIVYFVYSLKTMSY